MKNKSLIPVAFMAAIGGLAVGIFAAVLFMKGKVVDSAVVDENKPLYWVAPMDPNYRRDKPGKSPMGMDLIPVYEESGGDSEGGPGTITISPEVVNNLGVRTGDVALKTLQSEIVTVGYVRYDENKLIHIHPRVSGWVETLFVNAAGDPVENGAPLYSLYSPELVNAQEELLLALNRKNNRLVKSAQLRLRALHISDRVIDTLMRTQKVQQTVTFYSPQSGVIDNLNIREGFYVQPGTTMFSIGALDKVWVEAEIFERQASLVKEGDPVTMTLDFLPGKAWKGRVNYVYPTLNEQTRTVRVRISFDNAQRELKPNMFAQITIHSENEGKTLIIPREALIRTGSQDRVVLALGEGRYKSIAVKAGRINQYYAEILDGLEEGESIVTSAQFLLDSESSKTSDFQRMHQEESESESAWVAGEIKALMKENREVKATHEAIEAWGWPPMTMNFEVADSVDIDQLTPGTVLHMEIREGDSGYYEISAVHIMSHGEVDSDTADDEKMDHGEMDHSQRNHGDMDHGEMDHGEMDHSQMNHGDMDHSQHQQHGSGE